MSNTNIFLQMLFVVYMILFGAGAIFFLNFTEEIGRQSKCHSCWRSLIDFLTIIICGCVFSLLLIRMHYGMFRSYIVLGLSLGIFIYVYLLRNYAGKICKRAAKLTLWFSSLLLTVFIAPCRFFYQHIRQRVKRTVRKISVIWHRKTQPLNETDELEKII